MQVEESRMERGDSDAVRPSHLVGQIISDCGNDEEKARCRTNSAREQQAKLTAAIL